MKALRAGTVALGSAVCPPPAETVLASLDGKTWTRIPVAPTTYPPYAAEFMYCLSPAMVRELLHLVWWEGLAPSVGRHPGVEFWMLARFAVVAGIEPEAVPEPITRFRGAYWSLSNFAPSWVSLDGLEYPTGEHAYQAGKAQEPQWRRAIQQAPTPMAAKRMGRALPLNREWWEGGGAEARMRAVLRAKFTGSAAARADLLATWPRDLAEGNDWGDAEWGVTSDGGENRLGRMLVNLREDLRTEAATGRRRGTGSWAGLEPLAAWPSPPEALGPLDPGTASGRAEEGRDVER